MHDAVAGKKSRPPTRASTRPKALRRMNSRRCAACPISLFPPMTHSPGALAAGAADWIDYMASNSPELAEIFTGGFGWLDHDMQQRYGANFIDAKPEQQTAMLDFIAFQKNETPENAAGIHFFAWAAQSGDGRLLHQPHRHQRSRLHGQHRRERISRARRSLCSTR